MGQLWCMWQVHKCQGLVCSSGVRFPNPLLEVGWDYTAPIGGEFFFPPSQRGQFGQDMAVRVLIGFLNITGSHMLNHNFFHSLVLPLAADFYPPAICNFCWRHLLHMDFPFFSNCISPRQAICISSAIIEQTQRTDMIFPKMSICISLQDIFTFFITSHLSWRMRAHLQHRRKF